MRTPEQGHTKRCLAHAIICAVENERDYDMLTDTDFRLSMQENPLQIADTYLADGTCPCICPAEGE